MSDDDLDLTKKTTTNKRKNTFGRATKKRKRFDSEYRF